MTVIKYSRLLNPQHIWKHLILEELPIESIDGIEYRTHTTESRTVDNANWIKENL